MGLLRHIAKSANMQMSHVFAVAKYGASGRFLRTGLLVHHVLFILEKNDSAPTVGR
jgi:hypothetical protein